MSSHGKKSKKKKDPILAASGQTDAERRSLRIAQRGLQKEIASDLGDNMENPELGVFEQVRDDNNKLWKQVKYVREAVLDGDNLEMISARAAKQTKFLDQAARYDPTKVARSLRQKCTTVHGQFDWDLLGREVGCCFNAIPGNVTFFSGPIAGEYKPKERKQRAPRSKDEEEVEEERPEEIKKMQKDSENLSAVETHILSIHEKLRERCKQAAHAKLSELNSIGDDSDNVELKKRKERLSKDEIDDICAVKFLFDPQSFTQTVENIFHFSFLVKKGEAGIRVGSSGDPTVAYRKQQDKITPRQAIVPITMKDWKNMVEAYGVTECDIPHRTSKRQKNSATN